MAIERRVGADGKPSYRVRIAEIDSITGKRRNITIGTWDKKKDAEREERKAKDAQEQGTLVMPSRMTIDDVVKTWLGVKRRGVSTNTAVEYEMAYRLHVKPTLGHVLVQRLTHDIVQQNVTAWCDAKMSPSLVRRCSSILKQSLDLGVRSNIVGQNVMYGVELPAKNQKKDISPWSWSQLSTFLDMAEKDSLFPLWHILALEGCRRSEALGLRWRDVDFDSGIATIVQTVIPDASNRGAALVQERTKTKAGARSLPLTAATLAALKVHRDRQKQAGESWDENQHIITTSVGTIVNPSNVKNSLIPLVKRAGVPPITTHDLRHIAASRMIAAKVPIAIVSRKLGHANISITMDIYSHLVADDLQAASEAMDAGVLQGRELNEKSARLEDERPQNRGQ